MNKDEQSIMVVPRALLFGEDHFEGFRMHTEVDYHARILSHYQYMKRGLAEKDPTFKQPIGYCLIVNSRDNSIFAYQRASQDKHYGEKRLQGKWSLGIGGHIEECDSKNGNPLFESMIREIGEEVEISPPCNPQALRVLGYINEETTDVGKVHFGILYLLETQASAILPKAREIFHGDFRRLEDVEFMMNTLTFEDWSKISLEPLKKYFSTR